jgi:HD-like signal output (HDOD) protein
MTPETRQLLLRSVERLDSLPTVATILRPLLKYIEQPIEETDVRKIVEMVSCDESLAAQCLRLANSPLYCRIADVHSIRGAVLALGVRRLRELLLSCCLVRLFPQERTSINPALFWEHSFGCALLSRQLSQKLCSRDADRAYLAGLLHDCGKLVILMCFPEKFEVAAARARAENTSLHAAEVAEMGFTHCEAGQMLGEHWRLPQEVIDVIAYHHDVEQARRNVTLVALVHLADELCVRHGLNDGVPSASTTELFEDPACLTLTRVYPYFSETDLEQFQSEMDKFTSQVTTMVGSLFGTHCSASLR